MTTFAGQSTTGLADGIGTNAIFIYPVGLDMDSSGTLYVADGGQYGAQGMNSNTGNHAVRSISVTGDEKYHIIHLKRLKQLCCFSPFSLFFSSYRCRDDASRTRQNI